MILTVTINPLLEKRLVYDECFLGTENRNGQAFYNPGGKGINVSRQLNNLEINNIAYTFSGGNYGKIFRDILREEKIQFTTISTASETRFASVIMEKRSKRITTFFEQNHLISPKEVDEFKLKLEKMIANCEIVIFSGSSPCEAADDIIPFGIITANHLDKISICDTYGSHLKKCIQCGPTILHNNKAEIEKSLEVSLNDENDYRDVLNSFYKKGIKQAYITSGKDKIYASNFDFHFAITPNIIEELDQTGSGDAFTAGVAYGWYNDLTFEETSKFASSLGTLNAASLKICSVDPEEAHNIKDEVVVEPLGKKMKIVDVTPTSH